MNKFTSLSAANPFIAIDGLVDMAKIRKLSDKIASEIKDFKPAVAYVKSRNKDFPVLAKVTLSVKTKKEANAIKKIVNDSDVSDIQLAGESGKFILSFGATSAKAAKEVYATITRAPGLTPAPTHYYVVGLRAKTVKPDARKFKNKDAAYLAKRSVKIAQRKRLTAKAVELLPVYDKGLLSKTTQAAMLTAERAINSHINKALKVKELVTKIRTKAREERGAEYEELLKEVRPMLEAAGIKENNIVIGRSMTGTTMYVRMPNKSIMTIGLSNQAAFKKAKAESEAE